MKRILALMLALLLLMGGGALADMQSAGEEARAQARRKRIHMDILYSRRGCRRV